MHITTKPINTCHMINKLLEFVENQLQHKRFENFDGPSPFCDGATKGETREYFNSIIIFSSTSPATGENLI